MKQLVVLIFSLTLIQGYAQSDQGTSSCMKGQAFLGVTTMDVSEEKAQMLNFPNEYGAYIKTVYPGLTAEAAGVQPLDYIIGINEDLIDRDQDLSDLLRKYAPGDEVAVKYIRNGQTLCKNGVLDDRMNWSMNWNYDREAAFLGVSEHHNSDDDEIGVLVNVVSNSSAENMGLEDGDKIMAINGRPMIDWHDISISLDNMTAGDPITIDYMRGGEAARIVSEVGGEKKQEQNYSYSSSHSKKSSRGFLGIYSGHMDNEKAEKLGFSNSNGSYIKKVIPNTGASQAGLEPFDYVVGLNDYEVNGDQSLTSLLRKFSPGDQVTVSFIRQGQERSVQTTLGESSDEDEDIPCEEDPFFGVSPNHDKSPKRGVAVHIVGESAAADAGLEKNDVITEFNGYPIIDWGDLSTAISTVAVGESFVISYLRGRQEATATATMGSECTREDNWVNNEEDYDYDNDEDDMDVNESPAVDMDRIQVSMDDMDEDEAAEMAERGVDMPLINNLTIEDLTLFPNPNRGMFRLEFNLPGRGQTSIRVFNSDARLIYSFDLGEYTGDFSDEIDISQNGPGAYFLEVRQGATSMVKKIILQY